jgi:hypothetical protein
MTSFSGMPATKIRKPNEDEAERTVCSDTDRDVLSSMRDAHNKPGDTEHNDSTTITDVQLVSATAVSPDICDIAKQLITGTATGGAETKLRLINSRIPEDDFKYPARIYRDMYDKYEVRRRYCSRDWLHSHDYLAYSMQIDRLFCLCCVMFHVSCKTGQRANSLISQPPSNWKNAKSDLKQHATLQYAQYSKVLHENILPSHETCVFKK